jgi:hypothetical protein
MAIRLLKEFEDGAIDLINVQWQEWGTSKRDIYIANKFINNGYKKITLREYMVLQKKYYSQFGDDYFQLRWSAQNKRIAKFKETHPCCEVLTINEEYNKTIRVKRSFETKSKRQ